MNQPKLRQIPTLQERKFDYKILDLFAGAGGFSLGFEMAGAQVIGGIEEDKWATESFAFNHPKAITVLNKIEKITNLEATKIFKNEAPNVIIGGPPCQGFSICRKEMGDPKDPRNSLFKEFLRFGRIFEPKLMVMENVPNLAKAITSDKKQVIDIITTELKKLNYHVYYDILSATDYGIPQIRKRLFVIASKIPLSQPFPTQTHSVDQDNLFSRTLEPCPTLWNAISDLPQLKAREGSEESRYGINS